MRPRARAALFAIVVASSLAGCASEDVVIAKLDEHEAGPPGGGGCNTNVDCQPTEYCQKSNCAEPIGQCQGRPTSCDDDQRESCGCDGITYWNDCLRQQNRVASGSMGICGIGAARCDNPMASDCRVLFGTASCARLLPPNELCTPNVSGICYVLAPTCPMAGSRDVFTSCEDPRVCQPECDAIRSGKPHRPMCP